MSLVLYRGNAVRETYTFEVVDGGSIIAGDVGPEEQETLVLRVQRIHMYVECERLQVWSLPNDQSVYKSTSKEIADGSSMTYCQVRRGLSRGL